MFCTDDIENWNKLLAEVDDVYLTGIANKGIVKRAYKDKEEGSYEVLSLGKEAKVRVGEETVELRIPLGESSCSCPSRTICRHVVLAILALKEQAAEAQPQNCATSEKPVQPLEKSSDLQAKLLEEIAAYPLEPLRKMLGGKQLQEMVVQTKAKFMPPIDYANVITVDLQRVGQKVKLLSPLEYSSCTCHKKELCVHKAAALLWCKMDKEYVKLEEVEGELSSSLGFDTEQIKGAAQQMKQFLEELLQTGLARTSPDALDYMERIAIISHNARLAKFEGYWRALKDSYESYFKRKASFRIRNLTAQISLLYHRTQLLLEAESENQILDLAGEFKAEYVPVGTLDLTGIAVERFQSQTGYEGETVYFLEEHTKKWYTYTMARPVFYEKSGRRGKLGKAAAPWQIPLSMEELAKAKIHLEGAKADIRRRLSASQETKGELCGSRREPDCLYTSDFGEWYYEDFGVLFAQRFAKQTNLWRNEQETEKEGEYLVCLRPESCEKAYFSETEQKLFMSLFDKAGHEIVIEIVYAKEEEWGIRFLERITNDKLPYFLGKIYFREGRIRLYPVAVFEKGELRDDIF